MMKKLKKSSIKIDETFSSGFSLFLLITYFLLVISVIICDSLEYTQEILSSSTHHNSDSIFEIHMPDVTPTKNDAYLCTAKKVDSETQYIHEFEPVSDAERAHHMILFTCDDVPEGLTKNGWWNCEHHYQACSKQRIIYAWAKNAPKTTLPKDVGFRIGSESNIKNIILQVHYAHSLPVGTKDRSGFRLHLSQEEPKYLSGIMILLRTYLRIPGNYEKVHGDSNCRLNSPSPIHPFAYRVHTHKLGVVVSGYIVDINDGKFSMIGKGNPNWPQAFYPISANLTINPNDFVAARCTYSTLGQKQNDVTNIGMTAGDEMCNMYIMYYTKSRDPEDHYIDCMDEEVPEISKHFPQDSDTPLPRNETLEEHAKGHHMSTGATEMDMDIEHQKPLPVKKQEHSTKKRPGIQFSPQEYQDESGRNLNFPSLGFGRKSSLPNLPENYHVVNDWPKPNVILGQASGVDLDIHGNIVVFHRGDRSWSQDTFDRHDRYNHKNLGPIITDTVYVIHPTTGEILHSWGKNLFYLPHDITIAPNGDTFLTDVALHQVFKFEPGSIKASLVLGEAFVNGKDDFHFCKPAAVAVMNNGDFFVADGYCNSRIMKFSKEGKKILEWGRPNNPSWLEKFAPSLSTNRSPPPYSFNIPHALALCEEKDLLCVADRENGRIQCFRASDGTSSFIVESSYFGGRLFSVTYSNLNGGTLYAVNGQYYDTKVQGFVIPISTKQVSSVFSPNQKGFGQPHDIVSTKNGSQLYVVEISHPYKVWKFESNDISPSNIGKGEDIGNSRTTESISENNDPTKRLGPPNEPSSYNSHQNISPLNKEEKKENNLNASVIIMAFLTIPLLLLVGIGAILKLRSNGCCNKRKESKKSFQEFFPPSAGFEKLRMDESGESENSDTEIEEYASSSYRKASA